MIRLLAVYGSGSIFAMTLDLVYLGEHFLNPDQLTNRGPTDSQLILIHVLKLTVQLFWTVL